MKRAQRWLVVACAAWTLTILLVSRPDAASPGQLARGGAPPAALFQPSSECIACHNGLTTPSGEDISIGVSWRASMMANSSRDPYWHAAVRREVIDHPEHGNEIEAECAICHMPMAHTQALASGQRTSVFANLFGAAAPGPDAALADDGVSCTMCHQITADRFGARESFNGGFVVDTHTPTEARRIFGPFPVDAGRTAVMRSATGFVPAESLHVRDSAMCATCHTLYTKALGADGKVVGELPEQVPFLEWQHSAYRNERSCQDCHMPVVTEPVAISSVLGQPREGVARHSFRGGNFFVLGLLNRYRAELGVSALPQELDAAVRETLRFLQTETATLEVREAVSADDRLVFDVEVRNLSGHKFPTAYPSRRAWLHVHVRDADRRIVFESGKVHPNGAIEGNDNDLNGAAFEAHYAEIRRPDEVQIYESVMVDHAGRVTTGLLSGVRYVKDNRLLPDGFDKTTAPADVAVRGHATADADFIAGSDRVRYSIDTAGARGTLTIDVSLRFQPIAFRWARNLDGYDAAEPRRFVRYYDAAAARSSEVIARATLVIGR